MIEFLLYLSPQGKDIYNLISRKVKVVENTPICRKYDIYGWFDSESKTMHVCTGKIKSTSSELKRHVNETIFHESVHIAQFCKSKRAYMIPFGISTKYMPLRSDQVNDLGNAISISGEKVRQLEHEAFWMENKPDKVKYVLQKYCF